MKTKYLFTISLMIFFSIINISISIAQWDNYPGNIGGETKPAVQTMAVGDFNNINLIRAKLHINSFFLSTSSATPPVPAGDVLRTTAISSAENNWKMFTGTTNALATEKFSLYVPASSNNVVFQATQSTGELRFNTAGLAGRRFRIFSNGNVGVGDYNLFIPQSILHLHSQPAIPNGTKTYMQITDGGSGVTATDGFKIGTSNGVAEIRQQENSNMNFFTNNTQRATVTGDGAFLYNSTTGATPASGSGTRLMWIPAKAAFRAGKLDAQGAALWDDVNIGTSSAAIGENTKASGSRSTALGFNSHATGGFAMSFGNIISGTNLNSFIMGSGVPNGSATPNFINSTANSLMVGFGISYPSSSQPTLMVKGASTYNTFGKVGINTDTPGNYLEINSPATTPSSTASGLKFSDVNNTVTPPTNTTTGVLSLDNAGNVIWVADAGGGGGGTGTVTTGQNGLSNLNPSTLELGSSLIHPTDINLSGNNLTFSGAVGNVGIGGSVVPSSRLQINGINNLNTDFGLKVKNALPVDLLVVRNDGYISAGLANASMTIGFNSGFNASITNNTFVGVNIASSLTTGDANTALGSNSMNSLSVGIENTAVGYFTLKNISSGFNNNAIGSNALTSLISGSNNTAIGTNAMKNATNDIFSIAIGHDALVMSNGGYFNVAIGANSLRTINNTGYNTAIGYAAGHDNIGDKNVFVGYRAGYYETGSNKLYISNSSGTPLISGDFNTGQVGIGISPMSTYALTINGTAFSTATGVLMSDSSVKKNIDSIPNALNIISQLKPYTYDFDTANYNYMNFPVGKQFGFIGQEVEAVFPVIVSNNEYPALLDTLGNIIVPKTTYKGLNYLALIPMALYKVKWVSLQQKPNKQHDTKRTICKSFDGGSSLVCT